MLKNIQKAYFQVNHLSCISHFSTQVVKNDQKEVETKLTRKKTAIVNLYHHKTNTFFKVPYNESHIPHQGLYAKKKKEKIPQWESPPYNWPPYMPRPTMHRGKTLLNLVNKEYKEDIEKHRLFTLPNYRTGDVVDLTMFHSISEGKLNKHRGIVFGVSERNSINSNIDVLVNAADQNVAMKVKMYSPLVAKLDIHRYGSNKLRRKLNHLPDLDLPKMRLNEPIIKGRNFKPRNASASSKKKDVSKNDRGKIKRESVKMDRGYAV